MLNVVYILGAGFSEPLGLPLMKNFWEKSKIMMRENPNKYNHFKEIIQLIIDIGGTSNYFEFERFNIEETLSVIEMREVLGREGSCEKYQNYIKDVIKYYTPAMGDFQIGGLPANWERSIFGNAGNMNLYGSFVASLFNLTIKEDRTTDTRLFVTESISNQKTSYSIITLNYDTVLENVCRFFDKRFKQKSAINFIKSYQELKRNDIPLVKIHGCVEDGKIIPPTFNKGFYLPEVPPEWRNAYNIIMNANHIRIIGYSLPKTDSYIKYLMKAAVSESSGNLERVDVICRDTTNKVKQNYEEFFKEYVGFRFIKNGVIEYLKNNYEQIKQHPSGMLNCDKLEFAHEEFMALQHK